MADALPAGFELEDFDPLDPLLSAGVKATNGYRTKGDNRRLRAKGYTPAEGGDHERGDAVDLTPGESGWSLNKLAAHARRHFGKDATVLIEGDHVHVAKPGWGGAPGTPGTPRSGLPPIPDGFELEQRGALGEGDTALRYADAPKAPGQRREAPAGPLQATGGIVDGDTLRLEGSKPGRLQGVDAWELRQQGRERDGSLVPLGVDAKGALARIVSPDTPVTGTGQQTYGRPVVNIGQPGNDPAVGLLREGHGLAMPEHLEGDPRLAPYMEAERLARQNLLGGHGTNAETPAQFRHKDGPWQGMEPGEWGEGQAVFGDERTPFYGLRPEIEAGYLAIWNDPKSKPEHLLAYADANGFTVDPQEVRQKYQQRFKGGDVPDDRADYAEPPRLLTDPGDGRVGTTLRGVADPFNFIDELGGVADTLGIGMAPDGPRETIFNSDRRFGDVLWNNIDQNRAILAHDDATAPLYRLGGQLASGVALPYGAGVRTIPQLARLGAVEGFAAGFGAGEGGITERLPNAVVGSGLGLAGGAALGGAIQAAPVAWRAGRRALGRDGAPADGGSSDLALRAAHEAAPVVNDGVQQAGPTPAARSQPRGGVIASAGDGPASAAMRMEDEGAELVGPVPREHDVIDVSSADIPPGWELEGYAPAPAMGRTQQMGERATAEQMAAAAGRTAPDDVIPIPANRIEDADEAARANPGTVRDIEAPDEFGELTTRALPSRGSRPTYHKGPLDLVAYLRAEGGLLDQGGELSHLGMGNGPRPLDFSRNEQFLGRLIDNENGWTLDDAAHKAWEAGYFPDHAMRPSVDEFLDALEETYTGARRRFLPQEFEEVERFTQARAQRVGVEAAADEGSPLAERIGEPVTLDDLNDDIPAIAYEDLPSVGGKAGNIDVSKLETRGDIRRALQQTEKLFGGFDAVRRGKMSHGETAALADELGMRVDDLLKRRQGQAFNAEEALAARRILARSGDELVALANRAKGGSEDDLLAFQRGMLRHAAIQEQVTGMTSEAGRALSQFKALAKGSKHRERIMAAFIERGGGRDGLEEAAEAIIELQKVPGALNKFAADAVKPTGKDKAVELWYNSLLSNPKTHAVNILSNAITSALQIPEHAAAAMIGGVRVAASNASRIKKVSANRRGVTVRLRAGQAGTDRVLMSELGPRVVGLLQGAEEGLRAFRYTLKTGKVPDHVSKVEAAQQEAISGIKGKIIRTPTRLMSAEDEFFKAVARRSELAALSVRTARSEGLKGEALTARIAELNANPTAGMTERAMDYARYLTFQRPLGPFGQDVMRWTSRTPILKGVLPFVRTPTNLVKFAAERSPAAPILREVRADFKAGGARRDLAIARMTLGTGLGMLVASWAANGGITGGGPADRNKERLLRADGWQPYSVKIGDKYYSYQRLDPLAMTLGISADFVDLQSAMTDKQRENVAGLIAASMIQNLANKTWMSGASDVAEAIGDPQRYGEAYTRRLAGSLTTPAASAGLAQTVDPTMREARTILDAVRARIPGASQSLLPQRDIWGEEIERKGGLGPDIVSPLPVSTRRNDPVTLEALEVGAIIGKPPRDDMSPVDYNEFLRLSGQSMKAAMEERVRSPEWRTMTADEKRKAFEAEKKASRKAAKDHLFGGGADLPPGFELER